MKCARFGNVVEKIEYALYAYPDLTVNYADFTISVDHDVYQKNQIGNQI